MAGLNVFDVLRRGRDDAGRYPAVVWPGGYPVVYVADDGADVCAACVNGDDGAAFSTDPAHPADGWRIDGAYVHYEGPPAVCAHCGAETASAYGDPADDDAEPSENMHLGRAEHAADGGEARDDG